MPSHFDLLVEEVAAQKPPGWLAQQSREARLHQIRTRRRFGDHETADVLQRQLDSADLADHLRSQVELSKSLMDGVADGKATLAAVTRLTSDLRAVHAGIAEQHAELRRERRERARTQVRGALAKALEMFHAGEITAHQVATAEAHANRAFSRIDGAEARR